MHALLLEEEEGEKGAKSGRRYYKTDHLLWDGAFWVVERPISPPGREGHGSGGGGGRSKGLFFL